MVQSAYEPLEIVALGATLFHIIGLFCAVKAIMETRTSQGAIAWAIGLITFPYLVVPAYWVFGRSKFQGFVKLLLADHSCTDSLMYCYIAELKEKKLIVQPERQETLPVERLAKMPFTTGNEAELLINGEETFASIFKGIESARDYILVQFYIIKSDGLGNELKQRLIDKAKENVLVYFLYDEIGSIKLPASYIEELSAAGVEAHRFNTTKGRANRLQLNFRNHRKIVVVDGYEAWVGGHNVGDEYLGEAAGQGYWRDTHVRVAGPVVQCVQMSFVEDYHWATEQTLKLNWKPSKVEGNHHVAALALPSGPEDVFETCTLFFIKAINSAQRRLWIATPYFVPDEQFVTALHLAVIRGVDVRVLIPHKTDNPLVTFTHWAYVEDLLGIGARVYWYKKGFLHQKVLVVDDDYGAVGTANFDNRSFRLNFEITLAIADSEFNNALVLMLEEDLSHSVQVTEQHLAKKGFIFRFMVRAAQLTAPIQ